MNTQQAPRPIPNIQFRVLIIGRANAGKTSILQRICDTTDSPIIYRGPSWARKKVTLDPSMDRGEHSIDDELIFSNHEGYIFHDSRGIESGGIDELQILQQFIRRKCQETRLRNRLHAIWYCVPMDNQRPELDLKFFKDICPDQNVPVIVAFTKYDQFRRNIQINVEDFGSPDDDVLDVEDKVFQEHYLRPLGDDVVFVRLEKMHMKSMRCDKLIEATAAALNNDIAGLMLLAVQRGNLKLSVIAALKRVRLSTGSKDIVRECLIPFPYIWPVRACFALWPATDVHLWFSSLLTRLGHCSPFKMCFLCISVIYSWLMIFMSLAHPHRSSRLSFDLWYFISFLSCV
ncbi:hypothetical protein EDB84DRAFT_1582029 [Lactarius hengduanensis]|nr:hypothetical protein EDB84DRAFT_1582029 [Lactarius hengduanensis]